MRSCAVTVGNGDYFQSLYMECTDERAMLWCLAVTLVVGVTAFLCLLSDAWTAQLGADFKFKVIPSLGLRRSRFIR